MVQCAFLEVRFDTMADFIGNGKYPQDRAFLTISLMIGAMYGNSGHRKFDGTGSSIHEAVQFNELLCV